MVRSSFFVFDIVVILIFCWVGEIAPYLVTFQQWISYLSTFSSESAHQLEGFGLMQSARFNDDCIKILVANNPNLYNLQLSELGKLNDDSLKFLYPLRNLTSLDISRAGLNQGRVLTDDGVNELLKEIGSGLVELVLDRTLPLSFTLAFVRSTNIFPPTNR